MGSYFNSTPLTGMYLKLQLFSFLWDMSNVAVLRKGAAFVWGFTVVLHKSNMSDLLEMFYLDFNQVVVPLSSFPPFMRAFQMD